MDKTAIYEALDPAWWVHQTNGFNTEFVSTEILFDTAGITGCVYTSSAPVQTNGLNSSPVDAPSSQLDTTIDVLRHEAAQRLFDMHCEAITGHQRLGSVFNGTS
jgi:hypothetical protein